MAYDVFKLFVYEDDGYYWTTGRVCDSEGDEFSFSVCSGTIELDCADATYIAMGHDMISFLSLAMEMDALVTDLYEANEGKRKIEREAQSLVWVKGHSKVVLEFSKEPQDG
jgi:hypothetical protein